MNRMDKIHIGFLILITTMFVMSMRAQTKDSQFEIDQKREKALQRILVTDGSNFHNVGEVWVHVGNWGIFGSAPSSSAPYAHAPSAEWPAGSGVEYLYLSGLWVGAKKNGIPAVSTATYETEFRPTNSPTDTIYHTFEGHWCGKRVPFPGADDDHDGLLDEDWLNGWDDDGDGSIDEDFAGISRQMFSCWFTDDQPYITRIYPNHEPLHLMVRQESYQWEDDYFDDFVGITYIITNTGTDVLEDVYLGFFADPDIGSRDQSHYWTDDGTGSWVGDVCTDLGPVSIKMAYGYDIDGDGGQSTGYIGTVLLGHTVDPLGLTAPKSVGLTTYRNFCYECGGDPINDFERYENLSLHYIDRNEAIPRDYRMLIAAGPFPEFHPGETLLFHIAIVVGEGLSGLIENAAYAQRLYDGTWFNLDGNSTTGIDRRETPVYGPAQDVIVDECRPWLSDPIDIPEGSVVWVNNNCDKEERFKEYCSYNEVDSLIFRTGVAGKETQVHWLIGTSSPPIVSLDIRPGSCPNPFNVKWFDFSNKRHHSKGGVLPVAILGNELFDVHQIDISSLILMGARPLSHGQAYKDVSSPIMNTFDCECTTEGPDGYLDLTLKFSCRSIAANLSPNWTPEPGEERMMTLIGELHDGTFFQAIDCVKFVGNPHEVYGLRNKPRLLPASPNPFNPVIQLRYFLPEQQHVRLAIYNVSGQLIDVLVNDIQKDGEQTIDWHAHDLSSGIYLCHLKVGEYVATQKIVLIK